MHHALTMAHSNRCRFLYRGQMRPSCQLASNSSCYIISISRKLWHSVLRNRLLTIGFIQRLQSLLQSPSIQALNTIQVWKTDLLRTQSDLSSQLSFRIRRIARAFHSITPWILLTGKPALRALCSETLEKHLNGLPWLRPVVRPSNNFGFITALYAHFCVSYKTMKKPEMLLGQGFVLFSP